MILYIYITLFYFALAAALRHDVQMFQQNSYRYSRYLRWLKSNLFNPSKLLMVAATAAIVVFGSELILWLMLPLFVLFGVWEFRKKFKVKLSYTDRVKRLLCTSVAVVTCCVVWGAIMLTLSQFVALSVAILFISNIVVLLSNLINTPLERAITEWYINDARKIIASRKDLIIIGVTGSYGKTSTKNYLYRMLTEKYNVLVTPGNYNTLLGVVRTIREQLRAQHQVFIVEMGAKQRGDIKEICDLVHPSIGIVTSVGEAHLETFSSVENIQKTKFELIDSLPAGGFGVVNLDSSNISSYNYNAPCPIVSYSINNIEAHKRALEVLYNAAGVSFKLDLGSQMVEFSSPLLGGGNVLNLVAGIIVASDLGVSAPLLQRAIQQLKPVEHRLSMSRAGGLTILDDAYNSNPAGAQMALDVLRDFTRPAGAKRVVITPGFVEMGRSQAQANYQLGRQIAQAVDYAVIVNRLNREAIVKGLSDESMSPENYFVADSLSEARAHLATRLKVGDVLLYENDLPDSFK